MTDYDTAETIIKTIINSKFVEFITPFYRFELITQDPDDNKFVDCAISANARYIVTNDHHFDILKHINYPSIDVITLDSFMQLIS